MYLCMYSRLNMVTCTRVLYRYNTPRYMYSRPKDTYVQVPELCTKRLKHAPKVIYAQLFAS
jgi:hypothetical protein